MFDNDFISCYILSGKEKTFTYDSHEISGDNEHHRSHCIKKRRNETLWFRENGGNLNATDLYNTCPLYYCDLLQL